MRNEDADFYETLTGTYGLWKRKPDGTCEKMRNGELYGPGENPGTIFCERQGGTGVNEKERPGGSRAGDATKGNCMGQFSAIDKRLGSQPAPATATPSP